MFLLPFSTKFLLFCVYGFCKYEGFKTKICIYLGKICSIAGKNAIGFEFSSKTIHNITFSISEENFSIKYLLSILLLELLKSQAWVILGDAPGP